MERRLCVSSAMTTYQQVGGLMTFRRLVRVFYARVARDPLLQRLFSKNTDKQRERLAAVSGGDFRRPEALLAATRRAKPAGDALGVYDWRA